MPKSRKSKQTKMGKIRLPMDVRGPGDIPAFEDMISGGPIVIVLVHADDWCKHCVDYMKDVWSQLKETKERTVNLASIHNEQLPNTSLKDSKYKGLPSIMVVGPDGKAASVNSSPDEIHSLPKTDLTTMKQIITTPVPSKVTAASENEEPTERNSNSSFTPTINGVPITPDTDISLPSIKASTEENDGTPKNDFEKFMLNDFKKNTDLYIPKKDSAKTNSPISNSPTNTAISNSPTNTAISNSPTSNSPISNSPTSNSPKNTATSNSPKNTARNNSPKNTARNNSATSNSPMTLTNAETKNSILTTSETMPEKTIKNNSFTSPRHVNSAYSPEEPNDNTATFAKPLTPTATNVNPPNTEEDEVENLEVTNTPRLPPAPNQGATPLNLKGGRLFRRLTQKVSKSRKSTKRRTQRKK